MPLLTVYHVATSHLCFSFISGMVYLLKLVWQSAAQRKLLFWGFFAFFFFNKSLVVLYMVRKISFCYRQTFYSSALVLATINFIFLSTVLSFKAKKDYSILPISNPPPTQFSLIFATSHTHSRGYLRKERDFPVDSCDKCSSIIFMHN